MRRRRTTPREYALPTDIDDGAAHFDERSATVRALIW
jgi:hypothetical protein